MGVAGVAVNAIKSMVSIVYHRCGTVDALLSSFTLFTEELSFNIVYQFFLGRSRVEGGLGEIRVVLLVRLVQIA